MAYSLSSQYKLLSNLFTIDEMTTTIEYIDFSTDDNYIMLKDNFEEILIVDIKNSRRINTIFIEHDVNWQSDGLKIHESTKGVHNFYSDENKIMQITKLRENAIAVTDEMGTIRIFNYPCDTQTGNGYVHCYSDHLSYINSCVMSESRKYLITTSEVDRSIFIWKIIEEVPDSKKKALVDKEPANN